MKGSQLALGIAFGGESRFESFHPGPNAAAVRAVQELLVPGANLQLLLHGGAGSGKTHLALALAEEAAAHGIGVDSVSLATRDWPCPERLETLSHKPLAVLDGLDHAPLPDELALALLRALDALKARGAAVLITARGAPGALRFDRPDLGTRIAGFAGFGLKPLDDDDRARLLAVQAHARGLHLPEEVAHYLLRHLPRDAGSLLAAVQRLDTASLAQQRRLTIPFAQSVLLRGAAAAPPAPEEAAPALVEPR